MNAQDAKGAAPTPQEKFAGGGGNASYSSYPADDGRRYDPEALSYGQNGGQAGYAR